MAITCRDALAAQVGGIGIAPGGNINYITGHAVFEATHGTAPKYANQDVRQPRHRHPFRRHDVRIPGLAGSRRPDRQRSRSTIAAKTVTYDFARQMEGAKKVKCSEFGYGNDGVYVKNLNRLRPRLGLMTEI